MEAARDILRDVAETIELSSERRWVAPVPWHYALYIAEAFRKIVDDDNIDASLALGIRPNKAGRPRGATTHNKIQLAAAYWLLVRRGSKPEDAIRLLSKETGADRRTIQRAAKGCSIFKKRTKQINDELLKAFVFQRSMTPASTPRIRAALLRILDAE